MERRVRTGTFADRDEGADGPPSNDDQRRRPPGGFRSGRFAEPGVDPAGGVRERRRGE